MQKKHMNKILSWILCMALTVAMALCKIGCNGKTDNKASVGTEAEETAGTEISTLGEGEKSFHLTVRDQEGSESAFEIHTDKETVGEALLELGVVEGEDSEYGLYVTAVNGITADYETDGVYWAFYINDEYAQTGVDSTAITEGENYSFRIEK